MTMKDVISEVLLEIIMSSFARCVLRGSGYALRVAGYALRVARYEFRVARYVVRVTRCVLRVTGFSLLVSCLNQISDSKDFDVFATPNIHRAVKAASTKKQQMKVAKSIYISAKPAAQTPHPALHIPKLTLRTSQRVPRTA